jgi:hypothetical protein
VGTLLWAGLALRDGRLRQLVVDSMDVRSSHS